MKVTIQTQMGEFTTEIDGRTRLDIMRNLFALIANDSVIIFDDIDGKQIHILHSEALKRCGFSIDISEIKRH